MTEDALRTVDDVSSLPASEQKSAKSQRSTGSVAVKNQYWSYMSQPKPNRAGWHSDYNRPKEEWGTQQQITPPSRGALNATATSRVSQLATPKRNFQDDNDHWPYYHIGSLGRESMIWKINPAAGKAVSSPRVEILAKHKEPHPQFLEKQPRSTYDFSCGRESPIWHVRPATVSGTIPNEAYDTQLAAHKRHHRDFVGNRQIQSIVSPGAMAAKPTERLEQLSRPKTKQEGMFRDPMWEVSREARNCTASNRSHELAKSKSFAEGYMPHRETQWTVSRGAQRAIAKNRVCELANPITRHSMDHVQFNPDAFRVKETAIKGVITQRIQELSQPVMR